MRTVHRLDQVVGGLMVYGLTGHAASELSRQIREDQFQKEYQAVVHWRPQYDAGTYIDLLGRNEKTRKTYVAKVPGKGIQQAVLTTGCWTTGRDFPWWRSAWRPGEPTRFEPSFPPGNGPWLGTGSTVIPRPPIVADCPLSSHLAFTHPETGEAMDFRLSPPATEP